MKKFVILIVSLFFSVSLFAQNMQYLGITDNDCKNLAKNYLKIYEQISELDAESNDLVNYTKAETLLQKYGISGPNSTAKFLAINSYLGILYAEQTLQLDSESLATLQLLGIDPLAELKKNVNQKDYDVVARNYKALTPAIEYASQFTVDDSDDDQENSFNTFDDYSYGNDSYNPFNTFEIDNNLIEEEEKKYNDNIKFASTLADSLKSSKKDVGMLCKQYDKARASKYKLAMTIDENFVNKFSYGHYFKISYDDNPYYSGEISVFAEYSCYISYNFTGFNTYSTNDVEVGVSQIDVSKVEVYTPSDSEIEGEVLIYTKDAGIIHIWYNQDKAILQNGGIGPIEGYHTVPLP